MNIIGRRKLYYLFSGTIIIAGMIAVVLFGFKLGIDFAGGSLWEMKFKDTVSAETLQAVFKDHGIEEIQIQGIGENAFATRFQEINEAKHQELAQAFSQKTTSFEEIRFETVGPTIGLTLRRKAVQALLVTILAISLYIAWAFRKVSKPVSNWKYGVATIITLFHDVLVPLGLFAFLGHLKHVEIDSNFVVALLVVMGFSVHDTIVVFDRIRENLRRVPIGSSIGAEKATFAAVVNRSVNETLARSINTSLTTLLALAAVWAVGPLTLHYFVLAMMTGILTGTYSSIFIASPLLVDWERIGRRRG